MLGFWKRVRGLVPQSWMSFKGFAMSSTFWKPLKFVVVTAVVAASCGQAAHAQDPFRLYKDFDRYRYVPRLPQQTESPKPLPKITDPVKGETAVLVKELKAVIVVDHPDKVPKAKPDQQEPEAVGVQIDPSSRLSLARSEAFADIVRKYIGGPITLKQLNELTREIVLLYRECDLPVVDVSFPEQDITSGKLYMVITEAKIGRVCVDGACFFDNQMLLDQLFLEPGEPIYESELMKELQWLYRNPFRTIDLELSPGKERGETDILFHVKDRCPWRTYGGYEDTGTRQTQLERLYVGANWHNAFGRDDILGYQFTSAPDISRFAAHSIFYTHALENRDLLSVYANIADYQAAVPGFGLSPGESYQILARWFRQLETIDTYEHSVTAGLDWKQADSTLDFGPAAVFGSTFDVFQFMAGYQAYQPDDCGAWNLSADVYWSPGDVTNHNTTSDFLSVRADSNPYYFYTRGSLERILHGPCETEFVARATGQLASKNLVPTEQLGFGGYNSVRGYDQFAVLGDSGYFTSLEWWSPKISCGRYTDRNCECKDGELRGLIFNDYGGAYNHDLVAGEPRVVDLHGVGCGVRYNLGEYFQGRLDYGWQVTDVPGADYTSRVHINVVLSY